jgi:hypothetical protein
MTHSNIVFNSIKHHLGFIQAYVAQGNCENVYTDALKIGGSQMDLYIGNLTIKAIKSEIIAFLDENDFLEIKKYKCQLAAQGNYFECTLSDNSIWTMRMGIDDAQYIHIHPSRYALHTTRVKAGALKTAIAFLIENPANLTTIAINEIRQKLKLSPIKDIDHFKKIHEIIALIQNKSFS